MQQIIIEYLILLLQYISSLFIWNFGSLANNGCLAQPLVTIILPPASMSSVLLDSAC